MMPEMDGFDFLETLKHDRAWRDIPVIVMTALELTPGERDRLLGHVRTGDRQRRFEQRRYRHRGQ